MNYIRLRSNMLRVKVTDSEAALIFGALDLEKKGRLDHHTFISRFTAPENSQDSLTFFNPNLDLDFIQFS